MPNQSPKLNKLKPRIPLVVAIIVIGGPVGLLALGNGGLGLPWSLLLPIALFLVGGGAIGYLMPRRFYLSALLAWPFALLAGGASLVSSLSCLSLGQWQWRWPVAWGDYSGGGGAV